MIPLSSHELRRFSNRLYRESYRTGYRQIRHGKQAEYSPLIQQAGKPLYKGLFCASSDENIQGKSTAVLAQGVDFAWIFEEHRDSDRAKLWNMSYEHKQR